MEWYMNHVQVQIKNCGSKEKGVGMRKGKGRKEWIVHRTKSGKWRVQRYGRRRYGDSLLVMWTKGWETRTKEGGEARKEVEIAEGGCSTDKTWEGRLRSRVGDCWVDGEKGGCGEEEEVVAGEEWGCGEEEELEVLAGEEGGCGEEEEVVAGEEGGCGEEEEMLAGDEEGCGEQEVLMAWEVGGCGEEEEVVAGEDGGCGEGEEVVAVEEGGWEEEEEVVAGEEGGCGEE
jgi:hypothetical protein